MDFFTIFPPTPKRIRVPSGINTILGEFDRINNTNLVLDYNLNITRNKSGATSNQLTTTLSNGLTGGSTANGQSINLGGY